MYGVAPYTFLRRNTIETFLLTGSTHNSGNAYTDPTGDHGNYAVGMQEFTSGNDRLGLRFDRMGRNTLEVCQDISPIELQQPNYPLTFAEMEMAILDDPFQNITRLNNANTVLAVDTVTVPEGPNAWTFNFQRKCVFLDVSGATNDNIILQWDVLGGDMAYVVIDNLRIRAC